MSKAVKIVSNISATPDFTPDEIRMLMRKLGLKEKGFAFVLNVSVYTVQVWLAGLRKPGNASRQLMYALSIAPDLVDRLGNMETR